MYRGTIRTKPVQTKLIVQKKGIDSMLDVCKHCHQMTYIILHYKALMFCMNCNKHCW